jgi:cobalamin-dependent methionine synthase I
MKKAVAYLLPFIGPKEAGDKRMENPYGDREGDVHDIGKNIVVLACNSEIVDGGDNSERISSCNRTQCRYHWFKWFDHAFIRRNGLFGQRIDKQNKNSIMIGGATTSRAHRCEKCSNTDRQ